MNVAIFGGTFDPVHRAHLAVARAARRAFHLGRIYFVPADTPPHKRRLPITDFAHRYAMLALALRREEDFVPSLIESRPSPGRKRPNYTIDTVRRFRKTMNPRDRLFFIMGMDMYRTIETWHKPESLVREVEFIVVSRPGFTPPESLPQIVKNAPVHWLTNVAQDVSSSALRKALASGRVKKSLLDPAVLEYIHKEHLYKER